MKVLVIGGGYSDEREISLKSSRAVYDAVAEKHQKEFYDWDGSHDWLKQNVNTFDVVLPILHGEGGEDGKIQEILEACGNSHYLGSGIESSRLCMDKVRAQKLFADNGIAVPEQAVVTYEEYVVHELTKSKHVLKPIQGGSSVDTFLIKAGRIEDSVAEDVFNRHGTMILEELIQGVEVTVPILDGYNLSLIKIVPPEGQFFDYEYKYNGETQEICEPDDIDKNLQQQIIETARTCHQLAGCRHLSRVDFILSDNGAFYTLEINTIPGMTDQSLVPVAAKHAGMSWQDFVEHLITLAAQPNPA